MASMDLNKGSADTRAASGKPRWDQVQRTAPCWQTNAGPGPNTTLRGRSLYLTPWVSSVRLLVVQ